MTSHSNDTAQAEQIVNTANQLKEEGKLDEALALYLQAIETAPRHVHALQQVAGIYEIKQEWQKVLDCCQTLVELRPKNFTAHTRIGRAWQHLGNLHDAIPAYQRALELKAEQPPKVYLDFANALIEQERIDEAIAVYQQALVLRPQLAKQLHPKLEALLLKQGKFDEAAQYATPGSEGRDRTQAPSHQKTPRHRVSDDGEDEMDEDSVFPSFDEGQPSPKMGKGSAGSVLPGNKFKKFAKTSWRKGPKIVDQNQLEGKTVFPTIDIQWTPLSIIVFSIFFAIPYLGLILAAFKSGVLFAIISAIGVPIVIGVFIGILYFSTRKYR
jgi:predicted Zn-dependent protease